MGKQLFINKRAAFSQLYLTLLTTIIFYSTSFSSGVVSFEYNDFSDLSKWQINKDAFTTPVTDDEGRKVLRLTDNLPVRSGSAFITDRVRLIGDDGSFKASFSAYFTFRIHVNGGNYMNGVNNGIYGADGIAFVVQPNTNTAGAEGGKIGYLGKGMENSVGIEFDTWDNYEGGPQFVRDREPSNNHIGISTQIPNINPDYDPQIPLQVASDLNSLGLPLMKDGNIWHAWVDYNGDTQILEVRVSTNKIRPNSPQLIQTVDLPDLLKQDDVFVGFTSGTGANHSKHDILSFYFTNKYDPFDEDLIEDQQFTVPERSAGGTPVGTIALKNGVSGATLKTIDAVPADFDYDSLLKTLTVAQSANLDANKQQSYSFKMEAYKRVEYAQGLYDEVYDTALITIVIEPVPLSISLYCNSQIQNNSLAVAESNKRTFTTVSQSIELKMIDSLGNIVVPDNGTRLYYSLGNNEVEIGKNVYTVPFSISKSDTIRAKVVTNKYVEPLESYWVFNRNLPDAQLIATPSVVAPARYEYTTLKQPVVLSIIDGIGDTVSTTDDVKIWYSINNTTIDQTYNSGDTLWITGNDTLRATANLVAFDDPADGLWYYEQNLPDAKLTADPGSSITTFPYIYSTAKLSVLLSSDKGNTIHYAIASQGGSKDQMLLTAIDSVRIEIRGDDTVWAYADGEGFNRSDSVWTYHSDLPAAWLNADPSNSSEHLFGHTESILLSSNADTIRYTLDGNSVNESSTPFVPGRDTIMITDNDPDTIVLKGYAYGDNYKPIFKTWRYVRDTLPELIADPAGKKFTSTLSVLLNFKGGSSAEWENVRIYYTTDGSDPTPSDSQYLNPINLDTTTILKARAYADNRIESPILSEEYILVAASASAQYRDLSGDGAIDFAEIRLTKGVSELPDYVELHSPFNTTETRRIPLSEMELFEDDIIRIELQQPFAFTNNTGFQTAVLGKMNGREFEDNAPISIDDSVAPVLLSAEYFTGRIIETAPEIVREKDTLTVLFSEPVSVQEIIEPFVFEQDNLPYRIEMKSGSIENSKGVFIVEKCIGVLNPLPGDSIAISSVAGVSSHGVVQSNPENRRIEMIVHEPPYALTIQALTPVNPNTFEIPELLTPQLYTGNMGVVIVADFMMKLWSTTELDARITILDPVGNMVAESTRMGSGTHIISELQDAERTRIVFFWDGKNRNGRAVGCGSYLAVIAITGPNGEKISKNIHLGIIE